MTSNTLPSSLYMRPQLGFILVFYNRITVNTNSSTMWTLLCNNDRHPPNRDGPKFGERQSLAEEFGWTFGTVTLTIGPNFGKNMASLMRRFVPAV